MPCLLILAFVLANDWHILDHDGCVPYHHYGSLNFMLGLAMLQEGRIRLLLPPSLFPDKSQQWCWQIGRRVSDMLLTDLSISARGNVFPVSGQGDER